MAVDLTTYSDDDLTALRDEVNAESARRAQLRDMPGWIRQNASEYVAMGGDSKDLIAAINSVAPPVAPEADEAATKTTPSVRGGA